MKFNVCDHMLMIADVDLDIIAHLGCLRNINLSARGLYYFTISLNFNNAKILPIGMFSATSTFDSYVEGRKITPCKEVLEKCNVEGDEFRSRTFLVRYRDEIQEFNDAINWRITIPKYVFRADMNNESQPVFDIPVCKTLLRLEYTLFCAKLKTDVDKKISLYSAPDAYLPDKPFVFQQVAKQVVCIQHATTGIHEYFPIRFQQNYSVNLDSFVHCGITGIKPCELLINYSGIFPKTSQTGSDDSDDVDNVALWYEGNPFPDIEVPNVDEEGQEGKLKPSDSSSSLRSIGSSVFEDYYTSPGSLSPATSPSSSVSQSVLSPRESSNFMRSSIAVVDEEKRKSFFFGKGKNLSLGASGESDFSRNYVDCVKHHLDAVYVDDSEENASRTKMLKLYKDKFETFAKCGIDKEFLTALYDGYASLYKLNHERLVRSVSTITSLYSETNDIYLNPKAVNNIESWRNGLRNRDIFALRKSCEVDDILCSLIQEREKNLQSIFDCESVADLRYCMMDVLKTAGVGWITKWGQLVKLMPRMLTSLREYLMPVYVSKMRFFWKRQMMLLFCSESNIFKPETVLSSDEVVGPTSSTRRSLAGRFSQISGAIRESVDAVKLTFSSKMDPRVSMISNPYLGNNVPSANMFESVYLRQLLANLVRLEQDILTNPNFLYVPLIYNSIQSTEMALFRSGHSSRKSVRITEELRNFSSDSALSLDSKTSSQLGSPGIWIENDNLFYARGLNLFDEAIHKDTLKLCTIVVEQYFNTKDIARLMKEKSSEKDNYLNESLGMDSSSLTRVRRGSAFYGINFDRDASVPKVDDMFLRGLFIEGKVSNQLAIYNELADRVKNETMSHNSWLYTDEVTQQVSYADCKHTALSRKVINYLAISDDVACHLDEEVSPSADSVHLVILQHGFLGTQFDMMLLRNILSTDFPPSINVLLAKSNAGEKSGESLEVMGKNLADEIEEYIQAEEYPFLLDPDYTGTGRVSFIGHSAGGLIIRSALAQPTLAPLLNKLHVYMSLATPHLGTKFAESQLVSTGMWAMMKIKNPQLLKELRLEDSEDLTNCAVVNISKNGVLKLFDRIILVSSPKDQYVPVYSARMQNCARAELNLSLGTVISGMCADLLSDIEPSKLVRVSIEENVGEKLNVDSYIGRTAHIMYLDNPVIVEQIMLILFAFFV